MGRRHRSLLSLGRIKCYAKITFHPFVSRLRFCTVAAPLRHFRYLADAGHSFTLFGSSIYDSHGARIEDWSRFCQRCYEDVCAVDGTQLYYDDHSWGCDGAQVWKEEASGALLSHRWRRRSAGYHCGYILGTMILPSKSLLATAAPPVN